MGNSQNSRYKEIRVNFSSNMSTIMRYRKISLSRLKEMTGYSLGYLSKLRKGTSRPSLESLAEISSALNVDAGVMLDTRFYYRGQDGLVEDSEE